MKIKLLLCFFLGTFAFANAQMIEMTPFDYQDIPSIYLENLPQSWTTLGPRNVFTNKKKNVFVLKKTNKSKIEVEVLKKVRLMLTQNPKAKAFKVAKKWYVVNGKGKVIKKVG